MRKTLLIAPLATFALIATPSRAEIVTFNHDWTVQNVWGAEGSAPPPPKLDGVVKVGDVVHVSAWYDSALAALTTPPGSESQQYILPTAAAGMTFTVNGYVWRTSGYFHYDVMPSMFEAMDGHYVGEIDWYAQSWPRHDVTVETPFGPQNYDAFMAVITQYDAKAFVAPGLPTYLKDSDIALRPVTGAVYGGDYFFNFGDNGATYPSPIPEPSAWTLIAIGLGALIAGSRRSRRARHDSSVAPSTPK
ncbi:PEP-CTERM sorting domain-containing protein [Piscinibacter terrae]|uniref:PEP-CTERM sorting domain-containing protein n=1 Tax=Piscinibacter terrae TaxID=2496871 RepID=UPI000F5AFB9A|nr:PEP-CTERM sorting domain-containing protein [Albitalea terrae]